MSPRKASGILDVHEWADGETVSYGARVRYQGRQVRLRFGTSHEGWSEQRARNEIDRIVDQIARGVWTPPQTTQITQATKTSSHQDTEFLPFLYQWWQAKKLELTPKGRDDYLWRIGKLAEGGLGIYSVSAIDKRAVDAERTRLLEHGLAPRSVNMVLGLLAQVLDAAVDYDLLGANPARGRGRRVKQQPVSRPWLLPDQARDMIEAARQLEREARPSDRFGRPAIVATLLLAGPRVTELTQAKRANLDLHGGLIKLGMKTEAGTDRHIDLTAFVLSELRNWIAVRQPDGLLFPTRTGGEHSASNIRRLLAKCRDRANEGRDVKIGTVTPHGCRRTFASLCFFAGRDPRQVMGWLGHTDARMTLAVYAQTLQRSRVDRDLVWRLMRFSDEQETSDVPGMVARRTGSEAQAEDRTRRA